MSYKNFRDVTVLLFHEVLQIQQKSVVILLTSIYEVPLFARAHSKAVRATENALVKILTRDKVHTSTLSQVQVAFVSQLFSQLCLQLFPLFTYHNKLVGVF